MVVGSSEEDTMERTLENENEKNLYHYKLGVWYIA